MDVILRAKEEWRKGLCWQCWRSINYSSSAAQMIKLRFSSSTSSHFTRQERKRLDPAYQCWVFRPTDKNLLINRDLRSERIHITDLPYHPNITFRFPNCSCVSLHITWARESRILRPLSRTWLKEYKLHKLKAFKSPIGLWKKGEVIMLWYSSQLPSVGISHHYSTRNHNGLQQFNNDCNTLPNEVGAALWCEYS